MKVGDLAKITDPDKFAWAKHNPWMTIAWGLNDTWLIVEKHPFPAPSQNSTGFRWRLRNINTKQELFCKTGDFEVISESR